MRRRTVFLHPLVALALAAPSACSSSSTKAPAGTDSDFKHDIVFDMKMTVPANTELHQCQLVQAPQGPDLYLSSFSHEYTPGSDHIVLYRTTLTSIPSDLTGQYDCTNGDEPVIRNQDGIIYLGQVPEAQIAFPAGVAAKVPGGSVFIMNMHYLNATSSALDTDAKIGLDTTTADKVQQEGGFFLFYEPFIDIPANANASAGGRCSVPQDVTVVTAASHYHYRGTQMQVWSDPAVATETATPFYTTNNWEHPELLEGPVTWEQSSWIRYQCDYTNSGTTEVFQGPNAQTSEMCVLAGLYYPRNVPFESCAERSTAGFGTQACLGTATCLQACPAGDAPVVTPTTAIIGSCWQHCMAAACDGASDVVVSLFECASAQCATECAPGSTQCSACVASKCAAPYAACAQQTCAK